MTEFGNLLAFLDHDGILADQVDTADVAVEIDAHAGPIETRRNLLDVSGLAGTMVAGDHDAAVFGKTSEDGERRRTVKTIVGVDIGHVLVSLRVGRHFHITVDSENLPDRHFHVGQAGNLLHCGGH